MKNALFALGLTLTALTANAQTEVANYQPGVTLDGVNYLLPRTVFRVTVVAEKTVVTPGEMYKYADRYLRLSNVPTGTSTTWKIKSISLEPYGVPDKTKAFNIKLKSKTTAPLVSLTHDGLLLSINTEAQETFLPALPAAVPAPQLKNPRDFMNQEMLTAGSTAKVAELCAQEIYDIRESRSALIRGEADNTPNDGAQLQLMLQQLDEQAAALESLFKGTSQTSTEVFALTFDPTKEVKDQVLFRFSEKLGMLDSDDMAGEPIYISVQNQEVLPKATNDEATDKKKAKMQEKGVFYNVPAREKLSIYNNDRTFVSLETPVAQFGYTEILSDALFNPKNANTKVTFYQETGATKKIEQ